MSEEVQPVEEGKDLSKSILDKIMPAGQNFEEKIKRILE